MRCQLILNGKAAQDPQLRGAVAVLREEGMRLDVRLTWEDGDAARHVDEALAVGADAVIAAGGDGTLNAVCARLAASSGDADALPSVGVIASGTGNDFATAAGIPQEAEAALRLVAAARPCPVDLLCVDVDDAVRHWCVNVATGGFGTSITTDTDPTLKATFGKAAYLITGLSRFNSIEGIDGSLRAEGLQWDGRFLVLAAGNGRQAGGGHVLCPDALLDDGLLDLALLPDPAAGDRAAALGELLRHGWAAITAATVTARSSWLELETRGALCLNLDGEPLQGRRFRIEVAPRRLRMHLPRHCPLIGGGAGTGVADG